MIMRYLRSWGSSTSGNLSLVFAIISIISVVWVIIHLSFTENTISNILKLWSCFDYDFYSKSEKLLKWDDAIRWPPSYLDWIQDGVKNSFETKNMKSSRFNVLQSSGLSPTTLQAHPLGWVARWQTVADDNPRSLASSKSSMPSQDLYSCCCACHTGQCSVETDNVNDSFTLFCRVGISFYKLF